MTHRSSILSRDPSSGEGDGVAEEVVHAQGSSCVRAEYGLHRGRREIAGMLGISHSTAGDYVRRARETGVSWPLPEGLDDGALESALYPARPPSRGPRPDLDWERVHKILEHVAWAGEDQPLDVLQIARAVGGDHVVTQHYVDQLVARGFLHELNVAYPKTYLVTRRGRAHLVEDLL